MLRVKAVLDIPQKNYDLMSAVFIRLGQDETDERLIGMLQTIFTDNAPPEVSAEKLESRIRMCPRA